MHQERREIHCKSRYAPPTRNPLTPNPQGNTMKSKFTKFLTATALSVAVLTITSHAANFTWTGGGGDDFWKTGSNWVGGVAPGGFNTLIFGGTTRLTPNNNNTAGLSVYGIQFNAGAGAFTLSGSSITLSTGVTNNSTSTQTLDLSMAMGSNLVFNTVAGDIVSTKGISGSSRIQKEGLGTLTLRGTNSWSGGVYHLGGRLVYDYTGGGSFPATGTYYFGAVGGLELGNTTQLEIQGTTSSSLPAAIVGTYSHAASTIKLNTNVATTIASLTLGGNGTLNFDLTAAGSSATFTTSPALNEGLLLRGTVTDSGGTDFATVVTGTLQRFTTFDGVLTGTYAPTNNYTLSGTQSIGAANSNSVTITGGGSLTISGNGLWTRGLLMREGVSDFTMNTVVRGTVPLFIHQYSTDGALILNDRIHDVDSAYGLIKTGPGTVRITSSSTSSYTGATYVQEGLLRVDGQLTRTGTTTVFDGATLSGAGSIGSTSSTVLTVRAGGELSGAASGSLDITGTLALDSKSTFAFTLESGSDSVHVSGAVTLGSEANLELSLNGAPALETPLYLIRSDTSIIGNFVYNGSIMGDGDAFSLGGYNFTYHQDVNDIWVQAVPEPSVALLTGLGAALLLLRRRRS